MPWVKASRRMLSKPANSMKKRQHKAAPRCSITYIEDKIGNQDYTKGAEWLRKATGQEYAAVQYVLGHTLWKRKGRRTKLPRGI